MVTTESYFRPLPQNANRFTDRFPTVSINGVAVFDGTEDEAVQACFAMLGTGGKVATANLDFFALARTDAVLKRDLSDSHLVIADGMPVVWLGRLSGARRIQRLAGVDLVAALFKQPRPLRVAIYGSRTEICDAAVPALESLGSGARVVHIANPPFRALTDQERANDLRSLRESEPDVVLVALGCPAQERLIADWFHEIPGAVWIGVGGTLDFYAGVRRRAPRTAQRLGMEWAVRMVQEPRRLGRRYLLRDFPALAALFPGCVAARVTRTKPLQAR